MSTKAGTMGFSGRPALFTFWTVTVSVLAAAALILSAVALNVAGRGDRSVTSVEASGTREAESDGAGLWDAGKLSHRRRFLDEAVVALWPLKESLIVAYDRALRQRDRLLKEWDRLGRQRSAFGSASPSSVEREIGGQVVISVVDEADVPAALWDAGKLEAMQGRVLAG
jgi:hypothetical protein